ncbi:Uncharacterised protein [Legionella lansingensis]|uniref:Uncharacterized protein n=1 Tax=Legionella lansingensis TaxID=45067 RepID=A0A0W0VFE2_9GAMM|nr:hypothetical protein [Legionella lansingensis]KTD18833.1 hypothetical protein Llan_2436 [Legionella lansingensis]SNV52871.1 Uncharacterised protein [Legionella lansingensis]
MYQTPNEPVFTMQLLLSFCLLFFLNFAEVATASLDILVKQQKFAVPYMPFKGKKQRGEVVIINKKQAKDLDDTENLSKDSPKLAWSMLNTSLQIQTVPWSEQALRPYLLKGDAGTQSRDLHL